VLRPTEHAGRVLYVRRRMADETPPDRYHALDALRGFAMFLGVLLHAAIPYLTVDVPFWPVNDPRGHPAFDLFMFAVHDFRMQVFFLLAGFFGALLYARYGLRRTARHRLRRIGLPLVLGMATVQPATQAALVYAAAAAYRDNPDRAGGRVFSRVMDAGGTPAEAVLHHFASGRFLDLLVPAHLWFLWYLVILFALILPLAWVADRLRDRATGRRWDRLARWLLGSRWRWPVLTALSWLLLLPMSGPAGPDTPLDWAPLVPLVGYYSLFFLVGWTLYRHRDLLARFARGWPVALLLANVIVLPIAAVTFYLTLRPEAVGGPLRWLTLAAQALYTWLMVGGLLGLFQSWLSRERAWVRWLADSSYWCYLVSLPPVILFQYWVTGWDVPAMVKFAIVTGSTTVLLLVSYRWLVRYTWIGRLLNGPRTPPGTAVPRPPAVPVIPALSGRITG